MVLGPSLDSCIRPQPGAKFPVTVDDIFSVPNMTITPALLFEPGSTVVTIGSCFARNIEEALAGVGFDVPMMRFSVPRSEWDGARSNGILNRYTSYAIAQLVSWVTDSLESPDEPHDREFWIEVDANHGVDMDLGGLAPVSQSRFHDRLSELLEVCATLRTASIVVITLGQTESWVYEPTGLHWSGAPAVPSLRSLWPQTRLVTASVPDVVETMSTTMGLIRRLNPEAQVLLTISPVPATHYWSGTPALRAYWESKLTLWNAAQELVRSHDFAHYFPSFEAVHLTPGAWQEDRIHVTDAAVRRIVGSLLEANSTGVAAMPMPGDPGYVTSIVEPAASLKGRVARKLRGTPR